MKSIKPSRQQSIIGLIGSIFGIIFSIFWTFTALAAGAPPFFALFGIMFIVMVIAQGIFHAKNIKGKNRYSLYDITDESEESNYSNQQNNNTKYCPFCGQGIQDKYSFCPKCGSRLK